MTHSAHLPPCPMFCRSFGFLSLLLMMSCGFAQDAGRAPWSTSQLIGSPDPPLPFRVERIYPSLEFQQPVTVVDLPGRKRRLVLQRNGKLFTFDARNDVTEVVEAGDVKTYEPQLNSALDLTLDPHFEENGWLYIVWKANPYFREDGARVVRFRLTDDVEPVLDPPSRLDIFVWPSGDHAGSTVRFGPDGMLYVTMGDGSGPFPPNRLRTAQDLKDVRGSILRLDVDGATKERPYRIPPDNPFVSVPGARGEIFAFGFRNPWRIDFDPLTGSMYAGDVGWELWEMIHRVESGGNYGWSLTEGPQPIHPDEPSGPGPIIAPEIALSHTVSQSITGGLVVRKFGPPSLAGQYVCGDYVSGSIWASDVTESGLIDNRKIAATPLAIISFASFDSDDDSNEDLIVLDFGGGIYRLVENAIPDTSASFPRHLSQTGLFESLDPPVPAQGVYGIRPIATMWRDGAVGDRVLAVPQRQTIQAVKNRRQWTFPVGTVLANTISRTLATKDGFEPRRIETQVLLYDGIEWQPYTYRWGEDQQDAVLVAAEGEQVTIAVQDTRFGTRSMTHSFASRDQCKVCHHKNVPGGISLTPQNLKPAHRTDEDGGWQALVQDGVVTPMNKWIRPMVDPTDDEQSIDDRARSYLAANCSHCHQRGGGGSAAVVLSHDVALEKMNAVGVASGQGSFGLFANHDNQVASVIAAGHPSASVLMYRMSTVGPGRMPHLGSREIDPDGLRLVSRWIASLKPNDRGDEPSRVDWQLAGEGTSQWLARQHEALFRGHSEAVQWASSVKKAPDAVVQGLIDALLPPEDRSQRIGENPDFETLLALEGNADRGRRWFADAASSQCRSCHVSGGVGQMVGPALDGIGSRRTRRELLESLLQPSSKIEENWATYAILTVDGHQLVGLKISEDEDSIVLRSSDGKTHHVAHDDVEEMLRQKQSLMPTGLVASMTESELGDLMAYLESLRE